MPKKSPPNPLSLHGLTPEQVIRAFLRIKPEDVKKTKAADVRGKKRRNG
jgi:hypothetical protein